jgi:hypothetical protein
VGLVTYFDVQMVMMMRLVYQLVNLWVVSTWEFDSALQNFEYLGLMMVVLMADLMASM